MSRSERTFRRATTAPLQGEPGSHPPHDLSGDLEAAAHRSQPLAHPLDAAGAVVAARVQAVDVEHHVGPPGVLPLADGELVDGEPVVLGGSVQVVGL
jgi:hypothetical protein